MLCWTECASEVASDGNGADDDLVLQHDADHQEDHIEEEHDEAQQLAHLPLAGGDGDNDEEEHEEEEHDGTEEAITADLHGTHTVRQREHEPRERQPEERQENTASLLPSSDTFIL